MIRTLVVSSGSAASIPRESGDDPTSPVTVGPGGGVFPARAGMIRRSPTLSQTSVRIPRESGDDPSQHERWEERHWYSPRERG